MLIEDVKDLTSVDRFLYWIKERESIRLKKEAGKQRPWTDDTILQSYRFCNVRRMDDAVSKWLLEEWYQPNFDHREMLVACVLARHFNKPVTLNAIGFPYRWEPKKVEVAVNLLKSKGVKIFNAAYIITGNSRTIKGDKSTVVIREVIQPLYDNPPNLDLSSVQRSVEALIERRGLGWFMAGQIVADMRWAVQGPWRDRLKWAAKGPGSVRGICRLKDHKPNPNALTQIAFQRELREVIHLCKQKLSKNITKRLEAIDYQNCLCEFDKYSRTIQGEGRPKRKYAGV